MTALFPALVQVGKERCELALAPASGRALRKGSSTHRAMDHLAADVQLPSNRAPSRVPLDAKSQSARSAGEAIGPADLPTPLSSRKRMRLPGT